MPFQRREIPLPPGNWTTVALDGVSSQDDGPAGLEELAARIEGHRVTGLFLVRGSDRNKQGSLSALPPNRFCDEKAGYARRRLAGPRDGEDECWFVPQVTAPGGLWDLAPMPPILRIGLMAMRRTGEDLPAHMLGVTWFRIRDGQWIEVTAWFDPTRDGARATDGERLPGRQALADPAMRALVARLGRWTEARLPLLDDLGPDRIPADRVADANRDAPR